MVRPLLLSYSSCRLAISPSISTDEVALRRTMQDTSKRIIACTMAWTVPTLLRGIPGNNAAEVLADGVSLMQHIAVVAVGDDLRQATPDDVPKELTPIKPPEEKQGV
jgi:hypothetical protein